jgi:hypothetical protein
MAVRGNRATLGNPEQAPLGLASFRTQNFVLGNWGVDIKPWTMNAACRAHHFRSLQISHIESAHVVSTPLPQQREHDDATE